MPLPAVLGIAFGLSRGLAIIGRIGGALGKLGKIGGRAGAFGGGGGGRGGIQITTSGAEDFYTVARRLKHYGKGGLRKEVLAEVRRAAKPLIAETRSEARRRLPTSGGLSERIAKAPQRVQTRTGSSTAGVRIVVGGRGGAARTTDAGFVRHPTFGRGPFVRQEVVPGWFSETLRDKSPAIRGDIEKILARVLRDIARPL